MKHITIWLLVLALLLTGCTTSSDNPATTTPTPTEPTTAPTPVTLKVMAFEADQQSGWLKQQLSAFEAAHPEYIITWDFILRGKWDFMSEILQTNPDPGADVYFIRPSELSLMQEKELIAPIGEDAQRLLADQLPQSAWDTVRTKEGNTYALPLSCSNTPVLVYRKSAFTDKEIGSLEAMLEKGIVHYELGSSYQASMLFFANGCSIGGPGVYDPELGVRFGGPEGRDVARKIVELANHPNIQTFLFDQSPPEGGADAFIYDSSLYEKAVQFFGDDAAVAPLPTVLLNGKNLLMKNVLAFEMVCLGAGTAHPDLAAQLAAHLTAPEAQLARYTSTGNTPIARCLMDNPVITADPLATVLMTQAFHNSVPNREMPIETLIDMEDYLLRPILQDDLDGSQAALRADKVFPTPTALPESQQPATPPAEGAPLVPMRIWTTSKDWAEQMLQRFQTLHPEYEFLWVVEDMSSFSIMEYLKSNPNPDPAVDVLLYEQCDLGTLLELDALAPVLGAAPAGVPQVLIDSVTGTDGNLYGLPIINSSGVLYYNKEIYAPEDLSSLETMMKKSRVYYPLSNPTIGLALLLANGCTIYGPQGNDPTAGVQLGGDRGYEVLLRTIELLNDPALGDDRYNKHGLGKEHFYSGEAGAWIGEIQDYQEMLAKLGDKLGCAPLPTIRVGNRDIPLPTLQIPTCVGVGKNSRHPELAQELAAFLSSSESQLLRYKLTSSLPADTTLRTDPAFHYAPHHVAAMETAENHCYFNPSIPNPPCDSIQLFPILYGIVNGEITKDNYKERWDQFLLQYQ